MRKYVNLIWALTIVFLVGITPVFAKSEGSVAEEIEIGRKMARATEMMCPVTPNQMLQDEINKLGNSLLPYVNRKDIPYKFRIIQEQSDGENAGEAFSYSGGRVYISERLWRLITPDERIAMLAHEIAHVDLGHGVKMARQYEQNGDWGQILLSDPHANFGSWDTWQMAAVGAYLRTMKYSRDQEKQADLFSIELMREAGYSPVGAVTAMKRLQYLMKELKTSEDKLKSTHPDPKLRVEYLTKRCIELGVKPEDLEPQLIKTESEGQIGSIKEIKPGTSIALIDTKEELKLGDYVWVKKPLWDDLTDKQASASIAFGYVTEVGKPSKITLSVVPPFAVDDVMVGDQVYPVGQIDQIGSLGAVKDFKEHALGMTVTTDRIIPTGQLVWIKKQQWDEQSHALKPKPIAYGGVVSNGRETTVLTRPLPGWKEEDVDETCLIYFCRSGDDRGRIGSMMAKWENPPRMAVSSDVELMKGDEVWVERMDWNAATDELVPRPIAFGVVTDAGKHAEVRFEHIRKIEFDEINDSAGIYLRSKGELMNRLGRVSSVNERKSTITVETDRKNLNIGQKICVRKMVWDTPTSSIVSQTIAKGTLVELGRKVTLEITPEPECGVSDIDAGDEVFLIEVE